MRFEIDGLAREFGAQHESAHRGRRVQFGRGRGLGIECFETGRELLLPVARGDTGFEQGFAFFERRTGRVATRLEFRPGFGRGPAAPEEQHGADECEQQDEAGREDHPDVEQHGANGNVMTLEA